METTDKPTSTLMRGRISIGTIVATIVAAVGVIISLAVAALILIFFIGLVTIALSSHDQASASKLRDAIIARDGQTVRQLLAAGANPNDYYRHAGGGSWTEPVLYTAAEAGNTDAVRVLLDHGASVNARAREPRILVGPALYHDSRSGATPLHAAASRGHLEVVRMLLDAGAEVRLPRHRDEGSLETPLHAARAAGHVHVAALLVQAGAREADGTAPGFWKAVWHGLSFPARLCNPWFEFAYPYPMLSHHEGAGFFSRWPSSYWWGVLLGGFLSTGLLMILPMAWLQLAIPSAERFVYRITGSPLYFVMLRDNLRLKNHFQRPDDRDPSKAQRNMVLRRSALEGFFEGVELMLGIGADVNSKTPDGLHALGLATMKGHTQVIALLLQYGADVDIEDLSGQRPLHVAAHFGQAKAAAMLLAAGASPTQKSALGATALSTAAAGGHREVLDELLKAGGTAIIDVPDADGASALHAAVRSGQADIAVKLLDLGADVNMADNNGRTALHDAAASGSIELVHRLLDRGAVADSEDKNRQTPLMAAKASGGGPVVKLLKAHVKRKAAKRD